MLVDLKELHREEYVIYILWTILLRLIKQDSLDRSHLEKKTKDPREKVVAT